ncbi:thioredoxin domain-containing protein [Candidatus Saccharibacteria bacterium]|nr:thioredoxin domain-containing protein [Candidatus Saccharibacteria bacterium]
MEKSTSSRDKENRPLLIAIVAVVALFIAGVIILPRIKSDSKKSEVDISSYSDRNYATVIPANEDNGNIGEHIKGDESAPVTIFEYADFQCSGCANFNPWAKELLEEFDGKLRIVFRSFPLNIHQNAIAASSAAEAAGLQGYWEEYGDLLFANQAEWFYSTGSKRTEQFVSYFEEVTGGSGDVEKFRSDMSSENVKKKVNFDSAIAKQLEISATPAFFGEDGNEIEWIKSDTQTKADTLDIFRNYINEQLKQKN